MTKEERKQYNKTYRQKNRESLRLYNKKYNQKNRERRNKYFRQWYQKNKEYWRQKNKKKWKEYEKSYRKTKKFRVWRREYRHIRRKEPKFHLDDNMGSAIYKALKNEKNGRKWESLVGYTLQNLMNHLESQFDNKMSWENYGPYWHVDHIKPRSLFNYIVPEDPEFKECWSLDNLQPLEAIENIRKSDNFTL